MTARHCTALALALCGALAASAQTGDPARDAALEAERESTALYYASATEEHLAAGRMRSDGAAADIPFDADTLAAALLRVVFDAEAQLLELDPALAGRRQVLRRFEGPIRYRLQGDGARVEDQVRLATLAIALERASGLEFGPSARTRGGEAAFPTTLDGDDANMIVTVLGPRGRAELRAELDAQLGPAGAPAFVGALAGWLERLDVPCAGVYRTDPSRTGAIVAAYVFLKEELEDPIRLSCLHEEVAQSLGLSNDHADVRPSIFNDENEFAVLTDLDLRLVAMLYDPRLSAGMDRASVEATLGAVARDALARDVADARPIEPPKLLPAPTEAAQ